ncbi:hypothetical protein JCM9279_006288 [Rhodotorula babjevae]
MASAAPPAPPNANEHLFQGVTFFITPTVHPHVRAALTDLLTTWGGSPCPPAPTSTASSTTTTAVAAARPPRFDPALVTHIITDTLDFPEHALVKQRVGYGAGGPGASAASPDEAGVEVVTPAWVTRSFDLQVLQPPRFYSADRALFFSGTIVCTSELPEPDTLAIHSAVLALGGQTRRELTREVTHLVCAAAHGHKYEMALKFGTELGIVVVLPHWFEESLKLSTLVPIDIYRFPSPPFSTSLRALPSTSSTTATTTAPTLVPFATRLHDYWRARLAHSTSTSATANEAGSPPAAEPNTATAVILGTRRGGAIGGGAAPGDAAADDDKAYVAAAGAGAGALPVPAPGAGRGGGGGRAGPFAGKRVYLASDLGINAGLERALRARVRDAGGECSSFAAIARGRGRGSGSSMGLGLGLGGRGSGGEEEEEEEGGEEEEDQEEEEVEEDEGGERARKRRGSRGSTAEREGAWATRRRAEKRLRASDIVVLRTREGWEYWTAYDANLTIGNIHYLFHCLATSSLPSPLSRLLHYPLPSTHGLPAWRNKDVVMTVSNYAGPARDYVRAMIEALGARFEGTMSKGTSYVVSASEFGSKVQHARTWELPLVTHLWLEALLLEWRLVPPTAHPSYTLSGAASTGASATHFTTLLGDTAWTREGIERWAALDEQREARRLATRDVGELQREEEEELRRARALEPLGGAGAGDEDMVEAALRAARDGSEPAGAVAATRTASPAAAPVPRVAKARRTRSPSPVAAPAPAPAPAPAAAAVQKPPPSSSPSPLPSPVPAAAPSPVKKADREPEAAPPAPAPASKGKEREPLQPQPQPQPRARRSATREDEDEAMDVDEQAEGDEEEEDKAPLATPPKRSKKDKKGEKKEKDTGKGKGKEERKPKAKSSKKAVREPSSPLSDPPRSASPARRASSSSSSSSSDESPPPSAKAMGKTFALISDANLVVGGSKRGAAAKARAALVAQMGDRNAYEQELKSSGRKGGAGATRRSRSPRKASVRVKDEESEGEEEEEEGAAAGARGNGDEEDEPEGVVKRRKQESGAGEGDKAAPARKKGKRSAKAARADADDDDDELEDDDEPKKKKAKVGAGPAHKGVKAVQASATTTQDPGAVSSIDKPPNAKPPAPVAKKIRIISTGLQLDKSSPDIKALKSLGATWTDRPAEATHLVVKGISRTEKFLCCLPFAPKIVDKRWIDACLSANKLVDEAPYLLKDKKKEAEIGDTLEAILGRARKGKLFGGRSVYVTRGVQPDCATMQRILQAAGAVVHVKDLSRMLKKIADDPDALVVSAPTDRREWDKLAQSPYSRPIYSVEAVFASVMHMDLKRGFTPDNRVDPQLHDD